MRSHNPRYVEMVRSCHFFLTWQLPMHLLYKTFGIEERRAARFARAFRRTMIDSWFQPLVGSWLFRDRRCERDLRYIGCHWAPDLAHDDSPFKIGEVYRSTTFITGTYKLEGFHKRIGYAYFEVV